MRNATTAVREAVCARQSNTVASARVDSTKKMASVYKASNLASKLYGKSFKTNLKIVLIGRNTLFSNQSQLDQAWLSCMRFPALTASLPSTFGFVLLKYLDGFFFSTLSNKLAPFLICQALIS